MSTKRLSVLVGGGLLLVYIVLGVIFRSRLKADFVPFDHSFVGPNLVASFVLAVPTFAAGFITGRHHVKKIHAHQRWQTTHTIAILDHLGLEHEPHPHFPEPALNGRDRDKGRNA
jgi:hypothetical protein